MPVKYDEPGCCKQAGCLIRWMPEGADPAKDRRTVPGRQYGPGREGWAAYLESGGPMTPDLYVNVVCCPFCGTRLETPDA